MEELNTISASAAAGAQVEQGMMHFDADRFDMAMAMFEAALALDPNCAEAWNGIGRVRYHTGPLDAAIAAYECAISLNPHYIAAYYGAGILLSSKLGEYDKAIAVFQRGLANNPGDGWMTDSIGSTYARMGRLDEATAVLQRSLALNPTDTFALGWLGMIYLRQGRFDESIALYQREIEAEPTFNAHRVLGYALHLVGQNDEAITHLERAIALEPKDYEARAGLARAYRADGQRQNADAHEQQARAEAYADNEYGQACFESVIGNTDAAVALLKVGLDKQQAQPGWASIDPEFVFIGDDPRYKALMDD